MAILPLGTANDFATACAMPADPAETLSLAQSGRAAPVDCVKANELYFINVASGGFGAQVTVNTPVALKNFLGGGAYKLPGLVQVLNFVSYSGELRLPSGSITGDVIFGAVCNGRQAAASSSLRTP